MSYAINIRVSTMCVIEFSKYNGCALIHDDPDLIISNLIYTN